MDEQMRERFEAWAMHPEREMDVRHDKLQPETGYIDYTTEWAWSAWQAAAALSQPAAQVDSSHSAGGECGGVQEDQPVGEASTMPGTSGFTMACFKAEDVPVGTRLYAGRPPEKLQGVTISGQCQRILMKEGKPYPRSCAVCRLGPCHYASTVRAAP